MQNRVKRSLTDLSDYFVDTLQRTIIFLNVLKQRGDDQEAISSKPYATVFDFDHEIVLSGRTLSRPINYYLGRIVPPDGSIPKPNKAPVITVDPRAGQGPGISGFKLQSEIGVALSEGHPVYFIAFSAIPVTGQTFLDVVDGEVEFIKRVVELHPNCSRPIVIGNCQAGYQTLMAAMLRPDLFGTIMMAGSPMSYWQGVHGKNPMRYSGGLEGGSWLAALASDLGNGRFDGANLIANFDNLNPANFLWSKQYNVYANIDNEPQRYLSFEKWWGDFILLNGDEIQYLTDNLFVGNKLTANELFSNDGHVFDLRNITAPIICFTSLGDNISPPQQTLGWILDLYRSTKEIRERGQTIVYCVDPAAGHLSIFVSAKVALKEDASFIRTMDLIDCLPPGLYEMMVTPKSSGKTKSNVMRNDFTASFERRTLDDIRAFGRNSVEDDRAFTTVSRLSELNLSVYRTFIQPFVRATASEPMAELLRKAHPIRLSYSLFASSNPAMASIEPLVEQARTHRKPAASDNFYLAMQNLGSMQIEYTLNLYREFNNWMTETMFFGIYGSPFVQGLLGTHANTSWSREPPALSPSEEASFDTFRKEAKTKMTSGGIEAAIVRALLFVLSGDQKINERIGEALYQLALQRFANNAEDLKEIVHIQALVLHVNQDEALNALPALVPAADEKAELLQLVTQLVHTAGSPNAAEKRRLDKLAAFFSK